MEQSRRDFLYKGAAASGLVWAAPVITTAARVRAGTPVCACSGQGTALVATVTALTLTETLGPVGRSSGQEVSAEHAHEKVHLVGPVEIQVQSSSLSGAFDGSSCTASASVERLDVKISTGPSALNKTWISARTLTSWASSPCDCSGGADSGVADLTVKQGPGGPLTVAVSGAPNQTVSVGVVTLTFNEQLCDGDQTVVRALHVVVNAPGVLSGDVVVAESRAGNSLCGCTV